MQQMTLIPRMEEGNVIPQRARDGYISATALCQSVGKRWSDYRSLKSTGEFIEEQIFNWTYSDEQKAKDSWKGKSNPYAVLPRMVMLTYQLPDTIRQIAMQGEFDGFDLNIFFSAEGEGRNAKYIGRQQLEWDAANMRITNFEAANQFVKREYRAGWTM